MHRILSQNVLHALIILFREVKMSCGVVLGSINVLGVKEKEGINALC
jgi:hypothetical protein